MSDIITSSKMADGTTYKTRWHDNGDGTWSRVDYLSGGTIDAVTSVETVSTVQNLQTAGANVSVTNPLFTAAKYVDENGVAYGVKHVSNKPRVSAMPYTYDIAEGNVANHTPWSKIGYTPTMNTTESDVWSLAGVYSFPATAGKWEVVSSDNTQDIGTSIFSGTSNGGSTITLIDTTKDFTAGTAVAIGDCVILDKSGTTPEWGYVTAVAATTLTVAGGFSLGGTGASRAYNVIDYSANTGAKAVKVKYLDTSYAEHTEIIILNGTTAVDTVNTDYYRINTFRVIFTGSNLKPVGNLRIRADGGGTTYSYITAGFTRARNIQYTVPAGYNLFVTQWSVAYATTGNANKEYARLYTRANIEPNTRFNTGSLFYPYTEVATQNATTVIHYEFPTLLPPKTDIKVSGIASAAGIVSTVLRGWLETV